MRMIGRAGEVASALLDSFENARALDLCCGTGLSMEGLVDHPKVALLAGVDNCKPYLTFATAKFASARHKPLLILDDVVTADLPWNQWDLIMLSSAYHHIEHERKLEFLIRVRNLIAGCGRAVIAENILPEHRAGDKGSSQRAISLFYDEVLRYAKAADPNLSREVQGLIQRVAQYGFDGDYEYKTSYSVLRDYLERAGLEVLQEERVWPQDGPLLETTGGNYVFVVAGKSETFANMR
jgi:SAM-dependent methyltransferase